MAQIAPITGFGRGLKYIGTTTKKFLISAHTSFISSYIAGGFNEGSTLFVNGVRAGYFAQSSVSQQLVANTFLQSQTVSVIWVLNNNDEIYLGVQCTGGVGADNTLTTSESIIEVIEV